MPPRARDSIVSLTFLWMAATLSWTESDWAVILSSISSNGSTLPEPVLPAKAENRFFCGVFFGTAASSWTAMSPSTALAPPLSLRRASDGSPAAMLDDLDSDRRDDDRDSTLAEEARDMADPERSTVLMLSSALSSWFSIDAIISSRSRSMFCGWAEKMEKTSATAVSEVEGERSGSLAFIATVISAIFPIAA